MAEKFHKVKRGVLQHIQNVFEEMEEQAALSHQEKYALLEDAFENAVDVDELRVAFEQWFGEHCEELDLEYDVDELWEAGLAYIDEQAEEGDEEDDDEDEEDDDNTKNDDR